jgi:hypothetical protein
MAYTYAQLEGLWINNGGSASLAPIMAAIALAESRGNPAATNATDNGGTQTSWGLWQISDGTHSQPVPNILDPNVNAAQAVKKVKSQGLQAWGTYTSGAYKQFMSDASPVTTGLPTGSTSVQDASLTSDLGTSIGKGLGDAVASVFDPIVNVLIWGVEALLGIVVLVGSIVILLNNSEAGQELKSSTVSLGEDVVAPELKVARKADI